MINLEVRLGEEEARVLIGTLVIAGWAGRDAAEVQAHIDELAALGVPPPASTPIFYRISASRLTTEPEVEFLGKDASGEAECVLLNVAGTLWVGIGSDHTDRKAETVGIALSKQMCDKPVGRHFWRFEEVAPHWDQLILRSVVVEDGEERLYQDRPVADLLPPLTLVERFGDFPPGTAMLCGTVPVIGHIRGGEAFEVQLVDPVLNRALSHRYDCRSLIVAG